MTEKEPDSEIQPQVEISRASFLINEKEKNGIVEIHREKYPESDVAAYQSWLNAARLTQSNVEKIMESLQELRVSIEKQIESHPDSEFRRMGERFINDLDALVGAVNRCDNSDPNLPVTLKAVQLACDAHVLAAKRFERDVLRGREGSFNHKGVKEKNQAEAVRRIYKLMEEEQIGKTSAVERVREEYGASKSTVFRWLKKFGK